MPKYILTYFPATGIAQGIRFLLAYGGEEWEDRIVEKVDWPAFKPSEITMPKYILTYFPATGIAQGIRFLLAYGGEEWEDRIVEKVDWPAFKPKTKFGQIPFIQFDGQEYAQNAPIARYLGKKYGLGGKTAEEDLEIDQNVEFLNDIKDRASSVHYDPDKGLGDKKHQVLLTTFYPTALEKLNNIVVANNGYLACKKLTWGDFVFTGMYDYLKLIMRLPDLDDEYPALKKLYDTVHALPEIRKYEENSPKYAFG